ncbi:MAG TPA: GNVR domain-containing protein, partial [Paenalcaligenes sp.]|nr:GNVR domain-containing protein [Paenalcaligenes sp.]
QAELKRQLALLENTHVDFDTLEIVRIDQIAHTPYRPIKPNKKLIVAVAILLGGMLSVFITLIQAMVTQRQNGSHLPNHMNNNAHKTRPAPVHGA